MWIKISSASYTAVTRVDAYQKSPYADPSKLLGSAKPGDLIMSAPEQADVQRIASWVHEYDPRKFRHRPKTGLTCMDYHCHQKMPRQQGKLSYLPAPGLG